MSVLLNRQDVFHVKLANPRKSTKESKDYNRPVFLHTARVASSLFARPLARKASLHARMALVIHRVQCDLTHSSLTLN